MKKAASPNSIVHPGSARELRASARVLCVGLFSAAAIAVATPAYADPPAGAPAADPSAPGAANTDPPASAPAPSTVAPVVSLHDPANPTASPNDQSRTSPAIPSDVRDDVPVIALTHSAFGSRSGKVGAHGFGYATGASGGSLGGGGLTVYGSPLNRLTLLATAERFTDERFAPSASLAYRILGSIEDGWALAAMGTYKAEGFAEVEGEVELGAMFSLLRDRWHLDFNAVAGGGFEESEEFDAEAKLRLGYDVVDWLRLGLDSRGRYRLRGDRELVGGRKGDFIGGPQAIVSWSQFYGAVLAGVSTVDIASNVGATGWLTVGGQLP
jgi:hypothetical protein